MATTKPPHKPGKLTPKQQLFIREYMRDMNATQAYLRAYKVSEIVARASGPRMLENVRVSAELKRLLGTRLGKLTITNDAVLQEIAKMAFSNMLDFVKIKPDGTAAVDFSNMTREQAAAIQELSYEEGAEAGPDGNRPVKKIKFKLLDKKGSLELLGKYLKLFNDGTPSPSKQTAKVLKAVIAGEMTVRDAAYRFNSLGLPIPEALKIELSKMPPETPPPELPPAMDDEELEAGYRAKMAEIDNEQEKWLPGRQKEVKAIKDDLKDAESFGPDAVQKKEGHVEKP